MIDMKITEEEKKENAEVSVLNDSNNYPYGLKIHLENDTFKKLNIPVPQVGEKLMMKANVMVCTVSIENYKGDEKEVSICLQITDMDISKPDKTEGETVYGVE